MTKVIRSIGEELDISSYGGKAASLSKMKRFGFSVPEAFVYPAIVQEEFSDFSHEFLTVDILEKNMSKFTNLNKRYSVAVRSSAVCEDGNVESFAGYFKSYLGDFSPSEILEKIGDVYRSGFNLEHNSGVKIGVIVQALVDAQFSGVCFSSNPLTGSRDELIVSFTHGRSESLVSGTVAGEEFVISRDDGVLKVSPQLSEFPESVADKMYDEVRRIEAVYEIPVDIEWCVDKNNMLHYVQCRAVTTIQPKKLGLIEISISKENDFPSVVRDHDKVSIRLLCEEKNVFISRAHLHVAYSKPDQFKNDFKDFSKTEDCVSYSAVLVHPKRLGGKIVRLFAKNETTNEICDMRPCVRYAARKLSNQSDLLEKVENIHKVALIHNWFSVVIIQEIFEPLVTGILMDVGNRVIIELAYGHFVPKGVVPTSHYLLDLLGNLIEQEETYQDIAYQIENGEAVAHPVRKIISVSDEALRKTVLEFLPLIKKGRALEFGILEKDGTYRPYLIDLVDVSEEGDLKIEKMDNGIISHGKFIGKIIHLSKQTSEKDSFNFHFNNRDSNSETNSENIVYHSKFPDIALLKIVNGATPGTLAFVFDDGSFLAHLSIVLREKKIPAIFRKGTGDIEEGAFVSLDASTEALAPEQRLKRLGRNYVLSYINPDADGIVGSLAYSYIKEKTGEKYTPSYFGEIDGETKYILDTCKLQFPEKFSPDDSNGLLALVDTHHLSQLPNNVDWKRVMEIVDHHTAGNPEAFPNARILNEAVGAACTLLAEEMKRKDIVPPKNLAKAIAFAIVSNTLNFSAPSTTPRDHKAFEWLVNIESVSPGEIVEMQKSRFGTSKIDIKEALIKNGKKFDIHGHSILICQIESPDVEAVFNRNEVEKNLEEIAETEKVDYFCVSLVDTDKKTTTVIVADEMTRNMISDSMNLTFDGFVSETNRILLRKTDFIPNIERYLEK